MRVSIPAWDGGPQLSIKATCGDFDRGAFKKGRVVEVERSNMDGRKFRITRVFFENDLGLDDCECEPMRHENGEVTFFLGPRYWTDDFAADRMAGVMNRAFGLPYHRARQLMGDRPFLIRCRENQFTRFMYYRNEAGLYNGFMDLRMELDTKVRRKVEQIDVTKNV